MLNVLVVKMKKRPIVILMLLIFFSGCKSEKKDSIPVVPKKEERSLPNSLVKIFFAKSEISLPSGDSIHFASGNEVVLFRPTEYDFGLHLENTQDKSLLDRDGDFEELTNEIVATFKNNSNVKISICEKPMVAISGDADTLYFDTSNDLYGILFCRSKAEPLFKKATEENIIDLIASTYN